VDSSLGVIDVASTHSTSSGMACLSVTNTNTLPSKWALVDTYVGMADLLVANASTSVGRSSAIASTNNYRPSSVSVAHRRIPRSHHAGEHHSHHHSSDQSGHHASLSRRLHDNKLTLSILLSLSHASLHKDMHALNFELVFAKANLHVHSDLISRTIMAHKTFVIVQNVDFTSSLSIFCSGESER